MRILFIAIQASIHTSRWIEQIIDQGWDIHLAPTISGGLQEGLRDKPLTYYGPKNLSQMVIRGRIKKALTFWPSDLGKKLVQKAIDRVNLPVTLGRLEDIVHRIKPDVIHSMETQTSGYQALQLKEILGDKMPVWIHSNWGSDLYLYHRLPEHRPKIEKLLAHCDYFYSECERDITLARELGFKGIPFAPTLMAGGMHMDLVEAFRPPEPVSQRKYILLKGYQNWAGRALTGLQAIELCADIIRERGYKVLIQLADADTELAAKVLATDTGIPIEILPRASHEESLKRIGMARVHIGLSISDGMPMSGIEAMALGTFPIQSNTSCLNSIIQDGVNGFLVPHWDPYAIADALHQALTDDQLVEQAGKINAQYVREHCEFEAIKQKTIADYQQVFEHARQRHVTNNKHLQ